MCRTFFRMGLVSVGLISGAAGCTWHRGEDGLYSDDSSGYASTTTGYWGGDCSEGEDPFAPDCYFDSDCSFESYCNESGECVASSPCIDATDCPSGFECDQLLATCVPSDGLGPCSTNADCLEGCYCDLEWGTCVESAVCVADNQCGDSFTCDESISTCIPGEDPPPECEALGDEASCVERVDCASIYAGVDCTCGADCSCIGGEPGCVCATFEFFKCESVSF